MQMLITLVVVRKFVNGSAAMQFVEQVPLLGGCSYHLGVDGLSLWFLPLSAALTLLVLLADPGDKVRMATLLSLESCTLGMFLSLDLSLFAFWFVVELWPSWRLIVAGRLPSERPGFGYYWFFMAGAGVALLAAVALLGFNHYQLAGTVRFDLPSLLLYRPSPQTQKTIFVLLFLACAARIPMFPLHSWMPRVVEQSGPIGISVFLVGLKPAAFALMRFAIPLLPEAAIELAPWLGALGFAGMLYAGLVALMQTDLRRMLAFACISHMGVVLMGLAAMNEAGFSGALLQLLSLGVAISGLFLVAGYLHQRLGSTESSRMGGLMQRTPRLGLVFLVTALGAVGMPGTSGFNGEHLIMLGALTSHWALALGVGLATLLTAGYMLNYFQRAFLRPALDGEEPVADLDRTESLAAGAACALVLGMGLVSSPFVRSMDSSTDALAARVSAHAAAEPWFFPYVRLERGKAD
jgi:NADH-quinone oxidoreductase subunit M